ncbi:Metallo-dependent phosphatase [Teratosphaeria nubilosa]|uniref:Metallo-dependent phosphatase n=1 Tax=Teratosphaeria nubilosa TaxID=161662 RepID=A0A6G1KWM4_9PEZI|nr:Metallo-dependent phosphatase [Teratosphaeria nubilosa]
MQVRSQVRDVDTRFPYTGPKVPVSDWVDQTVNGNGKGFPRLVEPPAVKPASSQPSSNVNVLSLSYIPNGINIHYQTPFEMLTWPRYDRTPPCSLVVVTQCSQFFHDIQIKDLLPDTTYYYQIPAANGTTQSDILQFRTARATGDTSVFTVAVLNDMGYTNAQGTYKQLNAAVSKGSIAFAWHGGDMSYADDWMSGILPCESDWLVCYNGSDSELPNTPPAPYPAEYNISLPAGEVPNQGGPYGGDMSVLYESNWDLWQNWMNNNLNFTAHQHRFRMPGPESGGVTNLWYSFDYGLAHFIPLDTETDFPYSPEYPFLRDLSGNETLPQENETFVTDSGPFGYITDNNWKVNEAYEQWQWLQKDLASVDRSKTPWVIAMSHRPMYSSQTSSYQRNRLYPLAANGKIDTSAIINNNTYYANEGKSLTHIINGMAGNIESHSTIDGDPVLNITAVLNQVQFGFSKLTFHNVSVATWEYVKGDGSGVGDELTLTTAAERKWDSKHWGYQ